jgi:hypothetical protein
VEQRLSLLGFGGRRETSGGAVVSRVVAPITSGRCISPSFAAAALLLALVALAATLIPARAAMKVEPVEALRQE